MARRDRHTRIVGWLKIGLPLAALAILSTLFLLSRRIEPADDLPFAQVELEDRARRQQIPHDARVTRAAVRRARQPTAPV